MTDPELVTEASRLDEKITLLTYLTFVTAIDMVGFLAGELLKLEAKEPTEYALDAAALIATLGIGTVIWARRNTLQQRRTEISQKWLRN